MNIKYGKLISRDRQGNLTTVYPEIIIDDEVDFAGRNSTFPVTNIGIANAIDNAVYTAKNSIQYAFTSEDGGLGWNENTQKGYVDFSNIPASKVKEIALAIVKPNSAISIDSSSGKIDVDFSKLKPSDIVPLCDSGGGIVADTTNGKLRISFQNMNADGFSKLGVLPVANGGTGQTTVANIQAGKDGAGNTITATYVTLATAQNITGAKTFSTKPVLNQVGLDMTVKDTNSATTRTAQVLHANSDNAGYGINLGVGGSGNTVLGAGESCTAQLNELAGNASENLYLVSDGNIYFKPNGNTWSNAKTVTLNSVGEMSGLSKVTAAEFVGNLTGNLNGDVTGTFYGPCKGNADTASKLKNSVTINGTSFDGSDSITTSSWGIARNIYISDSDGTNTGAAVSINGTGNATLKLPATIKASITGNASGSSTSCTGNSATATKLATARNINGTSFDGSAAITTANWGTARNISISDSDGTNTGVAVSVNGSGNVTLKLPTTIKASITGNCSGSSSSCTGNAATATKLATARNINGTSFDGSAAITTANWGTARNISISDSDGTNTGAAVSVNGSGNATLKLPGTIKASIAGNASTATKLETARSLWGNNFDGSAAITGTISGTPSIEFKPAATTSNNGGYLDFHYNQSTANYTSRIIESESGTLNINNVTITTGKVVTATTFNGALTGNVTGNCSGTSANVTGTVAIANGGTGAITRLAALKNLTNENVGTSAQHFLVITDSWGKGGYASVANAKSVLGISNVVNINQSKAIKGITRNGTTFTYTCLDGTTGTFTQQDNNTVYTHPTTSGNKHIPSGGSSGQFLGWSADGTAKWVNNPNTDTVYTHPTTAGNKHIPSGGSSGQFLGWSADGTAKWVNNPSANTPTYEVFGIGRNGLVPAPTSYHVSSCYILQANGAWVYNGGTNTESDRRLKQDFKDISDDIIDIWENVHWLQFSYKKSVAERGKDAKIHAGLVVQDLHELYEKHGIDIKKYGITIHECYDEIPAQYDENGNLISCHQEAVDKWHLNYNEALAFEALYLRKKIKLLEERLTKLESKNN